MATQAPSPFADRLSARLRGGKLKLPTMPGVAVELVELAQQPTVDAERLSRLIHRDQALAARVLQVANSSSYRGMSEIVSLQQAVARLGSNLITELATAASLQAAFHAPAQANRMRRVFARSVGTALFAKEVARSGRRNVELAFLCGLMHNLGESTVLFLLGKRRGLDDQVVEACLAAMSDEAGHKMASAWKLPERVRMAMTHFRDPAGAPHHCEEVAVVSFARRLAWVALEDDDADLHLVPDVELLNLYPDEVDALIARGDDVRAAIAAMGAS